MLLSRLQAFSFPVPFKVVFKHSSATRNEAANFIVQATGNRSESGFGEGCPREYVTGEDVNSCRRFLTEHAESIIEQVQDVATLRNWIVKHQEEIDSNPSAFCAIEMAILDLLGVETGSSIEELLEFPSIEGSVRYSAVLGNSPYPVYWLLSRNYVKNGFRDIKIKISAMFEKIG